MIFKKVKKLKGAEIAQRSIAEMTAHPSDPNDPNPWQALYMDFSLPLNRGAKAAYLTNCRSYSRQFLLPIVRPFCRMAICTIQVWKVFFPNMFTSSQWLHRFIYFGMKYFVRPDANYMILRHFHVGSQILRFISDNLPPTVKVPTKPIRPTDLRDIYRQEIFVNHDINLYNFIINVNEQLWKQHETINAPAAINYDAIEDTDFGIEGLLDGPLNVLDLETAIELYTPIFQLLLSDDDFWRAHHSLQFDETIAIYAAGIIGNPAHVSLVNNKHPLVPLSGTAAAFRLVLHGVSSEIMFGLLARYKLHHSQGTVLPFSLARPSPSGTSA